MQQKQSNTYQTAVYLRLSKEDGDLSHEGKAQSGSIANQKEFILDFLASKPEFEVCNIYADDGYSGVDFNRPDFQHMMEAIKQREIDCVVVKDLSRFGRNYIEAGKYIEKLFPMLGVRFIAINDQYDSFDEGSSSDIIVPFKNLINDAYCRDISVKIRSHLEIKRKKGEFVGAFSVYGYKKAEENRNQLVIDEEAARVVEDIYTWRMSGMSSQAIADKLNAFGVLSPLEYKRKEGYRYATGFQTGTKAKWSAVAVGRILQNETYTGVLVQGKESTPNYKIKHRVAKPEEDWVRIEHAHEAIISKQEFSFMQELLQADTRTSPTKQTVFLYAGYLYCGDCGNSMVRRTIPSGKKDAEGKRKEYVYYVCGGNLTNKKSCSAHRMREDALFEAVLYTIRTHISHLLILEDALKQIKEVPRTQREIKHLDAQIETLVEEIAKYQEWKVGLYEDMREGILTKEEFLRFNQEFTKRIKEAEDAKRNTEKEINMLLSGNGETQQWMKDFLIHKNITEINRNIVIHLIKEIFICEDCRIEVKFRYEEQFASLLAFMKDSQKDTNDKNKQEITISNTEERQVI